MSGTRRMPLREALAALRAVRTRRDVVISAMGAAREWMALGSHPLDFVFVPSSMGQAPSLGLGMALARPAHRIIVLNGDGGMLMNLGSLVTISASAPPNFIMLVFDNGVYEVTGSQPTPGSAAGRADAKAVDLARLARASGIHRVFAFRTLKAWQLGIRGVLKPTGPTVAVLHVEPVPGGVGPRSPGPAPERAHAFRRALVPGSRA